MLITEGGPYFEGQEKSYCGHYYPDVLRIRDFEDGRNKESQRLSLGLRPTFTEVVKAFAAHSKLEYKCDIHITL